MSANQLMFDALKAAFPSVSGRGNLLQAWYDDVNNGVQPGQNLRGILDAGAGTNRVDHGFSTAWNTYWGSYTAFNPVTAVGWAHAYWTGGSEFTALNYSDTDPVGTFPDEIGSADLAAAGSARPLFSVGAGPNGNALTFDTTDDCLQGAFGSTYTQGYTVVMLAKASSVSSVYLWSGDDATNKYALLTNATPVWRNFAGSGGVSTQAADTNWHLFTGYSHASSASLEVDGTEVTGNDASIGSNSLDGLTLNCDYDGSAPSGIITEFVGVFDGDARTDPGWAAFEAAMSQA